jgi:murein DD-endopeptidase MepM/ murein hydrolase activator NlpD
MAVVRFRGSHQLIVVNRRYTIVLADRATGVVRRFTISLRPVVGAVLCVMALPVLIGFGARRSADARIAELEATNTALVLENESFRAATGELAGQITSLQTAVDDIGARAKVDPNAERAVNRLPERVRSRAMGGGPVTTSLPGASFSENTFGVLRDLLGMLEDRLATVRTDVDRRQALIAATPSMWPIAGWISSGFGNRRDPFTGGSDFHPGLDISADHGAPIFAPADGVVESASYNGNYGNMVVIDHGFGLVTRYGHMSRFAVSSRQTIRRGDVIGYVGSTGRSTSSHLHYEVLVNGQLTNPLRLLAGR